MNFYYPLQHMHTCWRALLPPTFSASWGGPGQLYPSCSSCNQQTHLVFLLFNFLSLFLFYEAIKLFSFAHTVCVALPFISFFLGFVSSQQPWFLTQRTRWVRLTVQLVFKVAIGKSVSPGDIWTFKFFWWYFWLLRENSVRELNWQRIRPKCFSTLYLTV